MTFAGQPPTASVRGLDGVTDREREVLTLIARSLSNTEIADHLYPRGNREDPHRQTLRKLAARDRARLVITAYESRLITPRAGSTKGQILLFYSDSVGSV